MPTLPSHWQRIKLWRRNMIEIWEEDAFEYEFVSVRLFARKIFLCNSPETVQFVFGQHNAEFERKSPQMRYSLLPLLGDGLFASDGETWRKRRRIVAPIIHISRLPSFAPVMIETVAELRDRWAKLPAGAEVDVLSEMAKLTAEVICRTVFGRRLGHDHAEQVVSGFSEYQRHIGQLDVPSLLGLPDWVPRWYSGRVRQSVKRIHAVLDDIIETMRKNRERDDVSVLGQLFDARDSDTGASLDAQAARAVDESLELAASCSREIRTLSYLLHPPLLDELGLSAALRWYADGFAQRSGIRVDLDVTPKPGRLRPDVELALFRIVQESLTNIHRHSGSSRAMIRVAIAPSEVVLRVSDEGHGMPHEAGGGPGSTVSGVGVGIAGMRERVSQLGGRLEIRSGHRGTIVEAALPLLQSPS